MRNSLKVVLAASLAWALVSETASAEARYAKIARVDTQSASISRTFFGRVAARQTVDFAFQVGGQIVELPVDEGARIAQGDLIAQLDLEPFELSLAQREAELRQAERNLERFERLLGSTVSQVNVDDAETAARLAAIAVQDAERSLRLATLKAPFDGLVARRLVPRFTTISAGTPVARLHDMSDLRVQIDVPELLFQQTGPDANVDLSAEFPSSDRLYALTFREVTAETTAIGQSFRITLGMEPPSDLYVLPGSSVTVHATLPGESPRLTVPNSALVFDADGTPNVMIFTPEDDGEGTVTRNAVEVRPTPAGEIEILSGLEAGTEIVVNGAAMLEDGERVRRFQGFTE